jgi:hypothetical protein
METPHDVDSLVTCRMPDPVTEKELYGMVTKYMLHHCNNRCQDDKGKCKKGYPFNFREETTMNDGRGWIGLKRPRGGHVHRVGAKSYDTRHVVPYNAYLLLRFDCHLNVLPFHNLRQARYLFKYLCKGLDCATVEKIMKLFDYIVQVLFPQKFTVYMFLHLSLQHPDKATKLDKLYAAMKVVKAKAACAAGLAAAAADAGTAAPDAAAPDDATPAAAPAADCAAPADAAPAGDSAGHPGQAKLKVLIDQITMNQDMRYMTASEAMWFLLGFLMHYSMFAVSIFNDVTL